MTRREAPGPTPALVAVGLLGVAAFAEVARMRRKAGEGRPLEAKEATEA